MMKRGPIKVLLVDDDEDHLLLSRSYLQIENPDFSIEVVRTAEDCLRLLSEENFDCVISDLHMRPGMDGFKLLQMIMDRHSDIRVFILTSDDSATVRRETLDKGVNGYFQKDYGRRNFSSIADSIKRAIAHPALSKRKRTAPAPALQATFVLSLEDMSVEEADESGALLIGERRFAENSCLQLIQFVAESDRLGFRRLLLNVSAGRRSTAVIRFDFDGKGEKEFRVLGEPRTRDGRLTGYSLNLRSL